jgi:glucose uptake protein
MFILENYSAAVLLCVITMLCWGSFANTQKLAGKTWRFELFYWDYVIGIVLFSLLVAFTLGSNGDKGRSFIPDLRQADISNLFKAFLGGIIFNAANILLCAAIAIAGMAVAFPVGIGIALVLGVIINFIAAPHGNTALLFAGVALVSVAIVINAIAYKKASKSNKKVPTKGIVLSVVCGILMSFFYRFIASSTDLGNLENPAAGKMTPYTAVFIFSLGILASNFLFNTYIMLRPFEGAPVTYGTYFKGKIQTHLVGVLGGIIWATGISLNFIAAGKAGPAISYGLGQGATLVAALWGVFIWKEFKSAPKSTNNFIAAMFLFFIAGLALIVVAGLSK